MKKDEQQELEKAVTKKEIDDLIAMLDKEIELIKKSREKVTELWGKQTR